MADYDDDFDAESPESQKRGGKAANSPSSRDSSPVTSGAPTPAPADKKKAAAAADKHNESYASDSSWTASSPASSPNKSRTAANAHNDDPDMEASGNRRNNAGNSGKQSSGAAAAASSSGKGGGTKLPPLPPGGVVAAARYPGRQGELAVVDYLDTSKPLVKSNRPVTQPRAPRTADPKLQEEMKAARKAHRSDNDGRSRAIDARRENERNYLKAQYEFEREKRNAERIIYQRERAAQWSHRLAASPLGVDLVADSERIQEEVQEREKEERRRRRKAERHRRKIKNDIVVKALAEVPLLDEARRQKREMLEDERRQRALRDVQRVEAVQARKLRDLQEMSELRSKKLETSSTAAAGPAARTGSQSAPRNASARPAPRR